MYRFGTCNGDSGYPNPISQVRLRRASLSVAGESIYDRNIAYEWTETPIDSPGPDPFAFSNVGVPLNAIFASNYFSHGSNIDVQFKAYFDVKYQNGTTQSLVNPVTATIQAQVHNVVAGWHSTVDSSGAPLGAAQLSFLDLTMTSGIGPPFDFDGVVDIFYANNYISADSKVDLTKTEIITSLSSSTAIFAITHGSQTHVTDSFGTAANNQLTWSDINLAIGDRYANNTTYPPFHITTFYSCSTIPGLSAADFSPWRDPLIQTGAVTGFALAGFDADVVFEAPALMNLKRFFEAFDDGLQLEDARARANNYGSGSRGPILKRGSGADTEATFKHCWIPWSLRETLPGNAYKNWFWVIK